MKPAALLLICLVTAVALTACAAPEAPTTPESPPQAPDDTVTDTEMDSALGDAQTIEQELDTADLDQIGQDLGDLDW